MAEGGGEARRRVGGHIDDAFHAVVEDSHAREPVFDRRMQSKAPRVSHPFGHVRVIVDERGVLDDEIADDDARAVSAAAGIDLGHRSASVRAHLVHSEVRRPELPPEEDERKDDHRADEKLVKARTSH